MQGIRTPSTQHLNPSSPLLPLAIHPLIGRLHSQVGLGDEANVDRSFRFDLDDVRGEVLLLRWSHDVGVQAITTGGRRERQVAARTSIDGSQPGRRVALVAGGVDRIGTEVMRYTEEGQAKVLLAAAFPFVEEGGPCASSASFWERRLLMDGNPLLTALPNTDAKCSDLVGQDLRDIPRVLERIVDEWEVRGCCAWAPAAADGGGGGSLSAGLFPHCA